MAAARIVQVLDFASARAPELQALHELAHHAQMQTPADAKLSTQRNQRRRRANAFKSHRMPQRLRQKRVPQQQEEELIALPGRGRGGTAATAATTVSPSDNGAVVANEHDDKQRCRKHERRPHKLVAQRSWQAARTSAAIDSSSGDAKSTAAAVWMTTHVWHSKRMKMVEKYGMMLPAHRTDKSVSAALEAVRSKATLHDMSYFGVLELYGRPQLILEALQLVSDPAGSDFHGMRFLSGGEEGQSVLYHEAQFPSGAICPVMFMWRPLQMDSRAADASGNAFELHADWQDTKRQLWLWIHPAAFMEAAAAVASACQSVIGEDDSDVIQVLDRRGHLCRFKLRGVLADEILGTVCAEQPTPVAGDTVALNAASGLDAESDHEDGFKATTTAHQCAHTNVALLRQRLATKSANKQPSVSTPRAQLYSVVVSDPRLRRISTAQSTFAPQGSGSLSLLREPTPTELTQVDEIRCPVSHAPLTRQGQMAEEPESKLILKSLSEILRWTTAPSVAASSSEAAAYPFASPLESRDVSDRITSEDVHMHSSDGHSAASTDTLVPSSFLWSQTKRELLHKAFEKDHALNESRYRARQSRSLDASNNLHTAESVSALHSLHLIAVEKPGAFRGTSGWDLVVPPSFAPVLLKTLVFLGALVVGINEDEALDTVLERPSFPRDFPDTQAGASYWQTEADARKAEHVRKPKAKRFAFEKHGVASPFQPDWKLLFSSNAAAPVAPATAVASDKSATGSSGADTGAEADADGSDDDDSNDDDVCVLRGEEYMQPFCFFKDCTDTASSSGSSTLEKIPVAVPTLVRVVLRVPGRASVEANAMMYAPTADDISCFYAQKGWRGRDMIDSKAPERTLVGFVTSAVYDRPKGAFRATGFCACEPLQDVFLQQQQQRALGKSHEALVMLRTPRGKMYRPVLICAGA